MKENKGFSLVELIIVIAIMSVLVGILAPLFIKYIEQSRRSRDIQTADRIREAFLADIADEYLLEAGTLKVAHNGKTLTVTAPEGTVFNKTTEDGVTTYTVAGAVAKIGDTLYASLADAIAAVPANGTATTIVMLADEDVAVMVDGDRHFGVVFDEVVGAVLAALPADWQGRGENGSTQHE